MTFTELCNPIFIQSIDDYHKTDCVDTPINNPFELKTIEYYLYLKIGLIPFNGISKTSFVIRTSTLLKLWFLNVELTSPTKTELI